MSKAFFSFLSALVVLWVWLPAAAEPVLKIDQLVTEALEQNPEITAARKRHDAAREKIPQAGALDDPMLGFGIINLPSDFDFDAEDMTMKEVSVSQKFPFPGKRPLLRAMAAEEAEAVSAEVERTANQVVNTVKQAFYDLSHVYRAMEVTRRNKAILEDFSRITQTRYSVGQGIQEDVIRVQVDISRMVDELIMLEQKKKALEAKLNFLLKMNMPIFFKSKQERKVAETLAELQADEASYETAKNELLYMVADLGSMAQRLERQIELYTTGIIPQAGLQIQTAMSAYMVNRADFMTLLDSRMRLYSYELEYHQALTEYEKNLAALESVVGRPFSHDEVKK